MGMSFPLCIDIGRVLLLRANRLHHRRIAAVAVAAAQMNGSRVVHARRLSQAVTTHASRAVTLNILIGLPERLHLQLSPAVILSARRPQGNSEQSDRQQDS